MSTPATQLKLGLFAIAVVVGVTAVALGLGLHSRTPKVRYHTYFDESVSGLVVGASVDFRGVRIGNVGAIAIAPDHRHVDVTLEIARPRLDEIDLPSLVATLDTSGITGVKFVNLSPRKADTHVAELGFPPAARYIPSQPSLLTQLADQLEQVAHKANTLVDHSTAAVDKLDGLLSDARDERVVARLGAVIDHADAAVGDVRRLVRGVDRAQLPAQANTVLGHVDAAVARVRDLLGKIDGDDLSQSFRDLGDAVRTFRDFVDDLEREPDILLKGRGRSRGP
jgi:ABC-type transporter Mla subunit MlaD